MKLFNKVAIIGVGLIGGSVAREIKKKGLAREVVGVSRRKKSILLAKRLGVIDRGSQDLNIIKGADLVILATPVDKIINLALKALPLISKECVVTDVGSTKQRIVTKLEKVFPRYIGTHPLAGSEKRGIANAGTVTLKDSLCIFTPTRHTDREALAKMKKLWVKLGAQIVFLNPALHDKILAFVSHLAHASSFSLIGTIPNTYLRFASGGLKDTTRIAASDSELWADIFLSNRRNITMALSNLEKRLGKMKSAINNRNKRILVRILKEAKTKREILG